MIAFLWIGCVNDVSTPVTEDGQTDNAVEDPCEVPGNICRWLGVPQTAMASGEGTDRGTDPATATFLFLPVDVTFARDGSAYYADYNNHRIRHVGLDGIVTTISGTGFLGDGPNGNGSTVDCWEDCAAADYAWNHPGDVQEDPDDPNVLWVAAWHNSRITRIDLAAGTVTWWAGTGGRFYRDGPRQQAILDRPSTLAFSSDGTMYFSDTDNQAVRAIDPDDNVVLVAGEPRRPGYDGDGGPPLAAHLQAIGSRTSDPYSRLIIQDDLLWIADSLNGVIRTIDLTCGLSSTGTTETPGHAGPPCTIEHFAGWYESRGTVTGSDPITGETFEHDGGSVTGYSGDGGDADRAVFSVPTDVAIGPSGDVYVVDHGNDCVRVIHPDHIIETFAGRCTESGYEGDEGPATDALLSYPSGVAVGPDGNVYIADTSNHIIRRVRVEAP